MQSCQNLVTYLCSMAIASLVFIWSKPNVNEKRRASSFMPQNADDERSMLKPRSDNISLNNCERKKKHNYRFSSEVPQSPWLHTFVSMSSTPRQRILPSAGSIQASLRIALCRFVSFYSLFLWWYLHSRCNTEEKEKEYCQKEEQARRNSS